MIYKDIIQGSKEWHDVRCGKFGASKCTDLFSAPSTSKYQNLINNVVYERLTNKTVPNYKSEAMQRGNDLESEARQEFEFLSGHKVEEVGYVERDEFVGMSPDGLIGEDTLIEIKCPNHTTQISYLVKGSVPKQYYYQIQFQLMVSEREGCWFFSYHPNLPEVMMVVKRDDVLIDEIEKKLAIANKQVNEAITKIKGKK